MYAVFLCDRTTGCKAYSFTTDGYGIFNSRTNLSACRTDEGGSWTNKHAQELTRRDRNTVLHPALSGDRTQGLRIEIPTHYITTKHEFIFVKNVTCIKSNIRETAWNLSGPTTLASWVVKVSIVFLFDAFSQGRVFFSFFSVFFFYYSRSVNVMENDLVVWKMPEYISRSRKQSLIMLDRRADEILNSATQIQLYFQPCRSLGAELKLAFWLFVCCCFVCSSYNYSLLPWLSRVCDPYTFTS